MALLKKRPRPVEPEDDDDLPPRTREKKKHRDLVPEIATLKHRKEAAAKPGKFRISQAAEDARARTKVREQEEDKPRRLSYAPAPIEPVKSKKALKASMEKLPKKQKKVKVEETEPPRTTALVPLSKKQARLTQKLATDLPEVSDGSMERSIRSRFGPKADTVMEMLEMNDTDGAITLLARSILQTMVGLLPVVEEGVRASKGTRGVYQLNQTVGTVRELMIDIRALQDKGNLGASIVDRTLRPSYADLAVQITLAFTQLVEAAKSRMRPEDLVSFRQMAESTKMALAQFMNTQYLEVRDQVATALS
jgi:hypothetical protein